MRHLSKNIALFLFLMFCLIGKLPTLKAQQTIQFSQYLFNGLYLNPGYAGYKENLNLSTTYRSQWTGINGAPKTFSASVDGINHNKLIGLGFSVVQDNLGPQSNLSALASFAYRLKVNENSRLSFGVSGGIDEYKQDGTTLHPLNDEPGISKLVISQIMPDLQVGLFYASSHYFAGISGLNLLSNYIKSKPTYEVIQVSRAYYFHMGALFPLSESLSFKPSFMVKEDFKAPGNIDLNTFLIFNNKLWLGLSLRTAFNAFDSKFLGTNLSSADAASFMVELFPSSTLRIGYSFDYTTSHLQEVSSGTHEISIGYFFRKKHYAMLSPRLF